MAADASSNKIQPYPEQAIYRRYSIADYKSGLAIRPDGSYVIKDTADNESEDDQKQL